MIAWASRIVGVVRFGCVVVPVGVLAVTLGEAEADWVVPRWEDVYPSGMEFALVLAKVGGGGTSVGDIDAFFLSFFPGNEDDAFRPK